MSKLLLASLVMLAGVTDATARQVPARQMPAPPPAPPPFARCDTSAPVLASIAGHAGTTESLFTIRATGRWDVATIDTASHTVGSTLNGCIAVSALDKLRATLRAATWKVTPQPACMAVSGDNTDYSVGGKVVWTKQMCPPGRLDAASEKAIAALDDLAADARAQPAPTNPPPAVGSGDASCTYGKQPMFEQELVVDDTSRTSLTVAIYAGGGWIRTWQDSKQKPDTSRGCLAPATLDSVRADLKAARWSHTIQRITCRAFSPRHTIYRVDGKQMWDSHLCGADTVDEATAKALARIRDTLAPVIKLDV